MGRHTKILPVCIYTMCLRINMWISLNLNCLWHHKPPQKNKRKTFKSNQMISFFFSFIEIKKGKKNLIIFKRLKNLVM